MDDLVIFCKSYAGDILRVERLARSLSRHNRDGIRTYVSVPAQDVPLFAGRLHEVSTPIEILSDEAVVLSNPRAKLDAYRAWDGRLSQQVVKSEFWRWAANHGVAAELNYVCIDSESEFIRDFGRENFVHSDGVPYTVMHLNEPLLALAARKGIRKIERNFRRDCGTMKGVFERDGPDYSFAPTPVIWSSRVWRCLDEAMLVPRGQTLWDAIGRHPNELHWYGEALLKYRPIPLRAIPPLFRVYHYSWEYYAGRAAGESIDSLRAAYLGVLKQSNWEYELDAGDQARRKSPASRMTRSIKRFLSRFR